MSDADEPFPDPEDRDDDAELSEPFDEHEEPVDVIAPRPERSDSPLETVEDVAEMAVDLESYVSASMRDVASNIVAQREAIEGHGASLKGHGSALETHGTVLEEHQSRLEALEERSKKPKVARSWIDRHGGADLDELADFVDYVNTLALDREDQIPACWLQHLGVVETMAALRSAWRHAMIEDEAAKEINDRAIAFFELWMWPTLARVRSNFNTKNCRQKHEAPRSAITTERPVSAE